LKNGVPEYDPRVSPGSPIRLDGRVAVVTGAGNGLGRSHAVLLAERGASVVVNDLGTDIAGVGLDASVAQAVVDQIVAAGGAAVASGHDIATPQGGDDLVRVALDTFGRMDIVVANAGAVRWSAYESTEPADFNAMTALHIGGAYWVTRAALPAMRAQRYGRVVFTTSASGLYGFPGQPGYAAGKAGVMGLCRTLAVEAAADGVLANCISPMAATRMNDLVPERNLTRLRPEQVSPVVCFLASERCTLTGEILAVGGGTVARTFVATTAGWRAGRDVAVTPELVATHLDEILDTADHIAPHDATEESAYLLTRRPGPAS
jgi:NAD(P)-dependent dehydrogenase (short-subunit alcohol dehydrogenase family)